MALRLSSVIWLIQQLNPGGFDLILMDCEMPNVDGFEASRRIRHFERTQGNKPTPIIALTAHGMEEARKACFDAGMDDMLLKPLKQNNLEKLFLEKIGNA